MFIFSFSIKLYIFDVLNTFQDSIYYNGVFRFTFFIIKIDSLNFYLIELAMLRRSLYISNNRLATYSITQAILLNSSVQFYLKSAAVDSYLCSKGALYTVYSIKLDLFGIFFNVTFKKTLLSKILK